MKKRIGSNEKIPNLVITPLRGISLGEIMEYEPILDLVRRETPTGIERAIKQNKQEAVLVEINNSGYYIEIPHKFWRNALNAVLEYYTDLEDYEKCIEIKNTLKQLDSYSKIPSSVRNKNIKRKRYGQ